MKTTLKTKIDLTARDKCNFIRGAFDYLGMDATNQQVIDLIRRDLPIEITHRQVNRIRRELLKDAPLRMLNMHIDKHGTLHIMAEANGTSQRLHLKGAKAGEYHGDWTWQGKLKQARRLRTWFDKIEKQAA